MLTLVDTPIWSLALRRQRRNLNEAQKGVVAEWSRLVRERRSRLIGAVKQEILSGIGDRAFFDRLRLILKAFEDVNPEAEDYEEAAACSNTCRAVGIAGSPVAFLICAISIRLRAPIFTLDVDFDRYAAHLPIRLHQIPRTE